MTMDAPDPDALFAEIMADVDLDFTADPRDVNYALLNDVELINAYEDVRQALLGLGEMRFPRSQKARELHSQRAAMLIVLKNRGLG